MDIYGAVEFLGEDVTAMLGGLLIGGLFGALAQRSKFCLRAATIEFSRGSAGPKVALWMLAFGAAVFGTQLFISGDLVDISSARQLATRGSLSGAIIGGLMFGIGMVLARGCASRLLVLSASGNLRALVTGLILTIVAQASLRGVLSPGREEIASWWTVEGGVDRDLIAQLGLSDSAPLMLGLVFVVLAIVLAVRNHVSLWQSIGAAGVGLTVALGWLFTTFLSGQSFEPVPVMSISFIGPSTDTLMGLINEPSLPSTFALWLVPGVFAGSFLAASAARDLQLQCFGGKLTLPRYIAGAVFMGFGGMLAGGCAVGAGITGGSVFALTAWVALTAMWLGAMITEFLIDRFGLFENTGPTPGMPAPAE